MSFFLRNLSKSDIELINKWRNDHDAQRGLVSPFRFVAEEVDERWFEAYLDGHANNIRLAIGDSDSHGVIGTVYLLNINWTARSGEFGIWVGDKAWQGKGAGEFATRHMLCHAFADLNLRRVDLTVLANNERAIRLYRKVGFIEEGCQRQAAFKNGEYVDLILMAMLSSEYRHTESKAQA
ncbi:N-acetyltransferase [Noviherbaspirillum cavernae]|uniref:N-acetyltransferase n=1 Tax=Noviherbaspirillum cavernae TaxID=2320862 RepID=A0A418X019_9BURK|nr:GNAT family protein [Noviherbaspirillum cavernae]RJG05830.1 N-acetyltransferase [Noviherbaspirillum cavernae]